MSLLILGLNILIIMAFWHFVVKRTLLDHTRDKLFDLRDEVRREHIERGWSLDSESYGNLRKMINAYLRYTETYSVWEVVPLRVELAKREKAALRDHLAAHIKAKFKTNNNEQGEYIANVRRRAGTALMNYAVYNSGLLLLLTMIMMPYFLIHTIADQCRKGIVAVNQVVSRDVMHLGRVFNFVWARSTKWVASKVVDQQSIDVAISNDLQRFA